MLGTPKLADVRQGPGEGQQERVVWPGSTSSDVSTKFTNRFYTLYLIFVSLEILPSYKHQIVGIKNLKICLTIEGL